MSEAWNQLLYWLTAQGQGSMPSMNKACQALDLTETAKIRRKLQLLGHLEVQPGAQRWSITRPCWVQSALGDCYFWTGERVPSQISPDLIVTAQSQAPDRLSQTQSPHLDQDMGCTSRQLLALLPEIDFWRKHLVQITLHHPLHEYTLKRWSPIQQRFLDYTKIPGKRDHGVYELLKRHKRSPMDHYPKLLYWDGYAENWLVADFTGLCFAHIYDNGDGLVSKYDARSATLLIPVLQRWPYIYERCLILASGLYPEQETHDKVNYLKYTLIPPDFMNHFEKLLDLRVENFHD